MRLGKAEKIRERGSTATVFSAGDMEVVTILMVCKKGKLRYGRIYVHDDDAEGTSFSIMIISRSTIPKLLSLNGFQWICKEEIRKNVMTVCELCTVCAVRFNLNWIIYEQ